VNLGGLNVGDTQGAETNPKEQNRERRMKPRSLIKEFLSLKRFAFVGVSRDPREFSHRLFKEFLNRGYDVIPVNPNAKEIDGRTCFPGMKAIVPKVTAAFVLTPRTMTERILIDCAEAGVTLVWIYGISGLRDVSPDTVRICEQRGLALVPGYCPYMFMPTTALFHRVHGFVWKLIGLYPP
jgi:predicted CoA-binding protein